MKSSFYLFFVFLFSLGFHAHAQTITLDNMHEDYGDSTPEKEMKKNIRVLFEREDWATVKSLIQTMDRESYFFEALSEVLTSNYSRPTMEIPSEAHKDILKAIYQKSLQTGGLPFVHVLKNTLTNPIWANDSEVRELSAVAFIGSAKSGQWPRLQEILLTTYVDRTEPAFIELTDVFLVAVLKVSHTGSWSLFWNRNPNLLERAQKAAKNKYYYMGERNMKRQNAKTSKVRLSCPMVFKAKR